MDTRSLTLTLLLVLFFRPILSDGPSPSLWPFLLDSFPSPLSLDSPPPPPPTFPPPPPPPPTFPPPPPPPPPPLPPTPPPPPAPRFTPPNWTGPDRPGLRLNPPPNTSPTPPGSSSSSSCPPGRDCNQHRQSVNRESPTRPGLNFGEKLGLFFIGVFVALQVVLGSYLVYIRRS